MWWTRLPEANRGGARLAAHGSLARCPGELASSTGIGARAEDPPRERDTLPQRRGAPAQERSGAGGTCTGRGVAESHARTRPRDSAGAADEEQEEGEEEGEEERLGG